MELKATVISGLNADPDPFTHHEFRDFSESRIAKRFWGRIDYMIAEAQRQCETGSDVTDMYRAQGTLTALRCVKRLPEILEKELIDSKPVFTRKELLNQPKWKE